MTRPQVDLTAERWQVRQDSRKNLYTGKTYNSVENVAQFFKERGVNVPIRRQRLRRAGCSETCRLLDRARRCRKPRQPRRQPARTGTVVEHPKYGTGTIVRREGEGDDAKVIVIFQRHGMKKLVEKYAGLTKA